MNVSKINEALTQYIREAAPLKSPHKGTGTLKSNHKLESLTQRLFETLKTCESLEVSHSLEGTDKAWSELATKISYLENFVNESVENDEIDQNTATLLDTTYQHLESVKSIAKNHLSSKTVSPIGKLNLQNAAEVAAVSGEETRNRATIKNIRTQALAEIQQGIPPTEVARRLSHGIANFVKNLYAEGLAKLGPSPENCKFSLVVLGSMARLESGPYPDVDNILVVEKKTPQILHYFTKLNQYVADRIYRLGETESLGKSGLRFCEGNLNPRYLRYEYRYIDNPARNYRTTKANELKAKRQELANLNEEIAKAKEAQENPLTSNVSAVQERLQSLTLKQKEISADIADLAKNENELQAKEEELVKVTNEIDKILKGMENQSFSNSPDNEEKLRGLYLKQQEISDDIENRSEAYAGRSYLTVEANVLDPTLGPKGEGSISDSRPILGDDTLYQNYMQWRQDTVPTDQRQKQIFDSLKSTAKNMREDDVPGPIITQKASGFMHIKHELYRFPQVVVSTLANHYGIKSTNTIERIEALRQMGKLHPELSTRLIAAMNHLIKLRICVQSSYGEEFECVCPGDWASLQSAKQQLGQEIAALEALNLPDEIKKCESQLTFLKTKKESGDDRAEEGIKNVEKQLEELKAKGNKLKFYRMRLNEEAPKMERTMLRHEIAHLEKQYGNLPMQIKQCERNIERYRGKVNVGDERAQRNLTQAEAQLLALKAIASKLESHKKFYKLLQEKDPQSKALQAYYDEMAKVTLENRIILKDELTRLQQDTLPTLHHLYEKLEQSVSGETFDPTIFFAA